MTNRLPLFVLLLLAAWSLIGAQLPAPQEDQTITVVGMILNVSSSRPKGPPERWKIDLNDDMNAELTLLRSGARLAGSALVEAGLKVEVVITPLDVENKTYGLVRWVRIGLRR